ncbi:MAG TPA: Crp/Fnr family transcriptional regulator [Gammaproteobacteria bacterium]|nr:Crp/Fnr family transcriptional regulator [Gammaproteobacteria bacterium]
MHEGEPTGGDRPPGLEGQRRSRCSACPQRAHCLPAQLEGTALAEFERAVIHLPTLFKGRTLVSEGEPFQALYALRRGILKAVRHDANGDEQIIAFHWPGTVLGIAEQESGVWTASQAALTDAWLCRIPAGLITPAMQCRASQLLIAAVRVEYERLLILAHRDAAQRLATMLVYVCEAMGAQRLSLSMSRADLANYLGLRQETLSRQLRELVACGWVATQGRNIEIRDLAGLWRFATG